LQTLIQFALQFKFLAIFSSNLDEFFEVRVGRLMAMERDLPHLLSQESLTPTEQLSQIRQRLPPAVDQQIQIFRDLRRRLELEHVYIRKWDELNAREREALSHYFEQNVMDALTPLSVDSSHPFAYVSNLSLNIGFSILDPVTSQEKFARVKIPTSSPRLVNLTTLLTESSSATPAPTSENPTILVPMEEIIYGNSAELFRGMRITGRCVFRLTRHADLGLYGDIEGDLREVIESQTKKHRRAEPAIRLEIDFPDRKKRKEGGEQSRSALFSPATDGDEDEEKEVSAEEKVVSLLVSRLKIRREDVYLKWVLGCLLEIRWLG
jgi:polyphosphate kinase